MFAIIKKPKRHNHHLTFIIILIISINITKLKNKFVHKNNFITVRKYATSLREFIGK